MISIRTDEEFKRLVRPLDDDEYARLKESIESEGCRDPLVLWEEESILLDGNNRYSICQAIGKSYETTIVSLPDRLAARKWIINNQLARRNLTPNELSYYRGLRYEAEKLSMQEAGAKKASVNTTEALITSQQLAEEYGVSEKTIRNDAEFARAVNVAEEKLGVDVKRQALKGDISKKELREALRTDRWQAILTSETPEWWTPKKYIDAVHEVMGGIDLDPASCKEANEVVRAKKIYTKSDDGLLIRWYGKVFLNPPYGKLGPSFVEKLYNELCSNVDEAILLVNSRATDAEWFQQCFDGLICFTDHRIDFNSPSEKASSSTHGSCIVYFGPNKKKFAEAFSQFGNVVWRWHNDKS